ncbi:MAG: NifB/NifX family molybdenum-iron cluster-binding protein [Candidatus Methanofastidiosia archaeon]
MKIALSTMGDSIESTVEPRFGRCANFVIVDSETSQTNVIRNEAAFARGGAGIKAAEAVIKEGALVVITGNVGPNAFATLSAANINVITGASGIIKDVIEQYKNGKLSTTSSHTVNAHFGDSRSFGRRGGRR